MTSWKQLHAGVRKVCRGLPEAIETETFGNPTWKAGKKSFAVLGDYAPARVLSFKATPEERLALLEDDRFSVARYVGQHGWLVLRLDTDVDWDEIEELIIDSYRLVALKRMLRQLDG